ETSEFLLAHLEQQNALLDMDPKAICIESNQLRSTFSTIQKLVMDSNKSTALQMAQALPTSPLKGAFSIADIHSNSSEEYLRTIDWDFWGALIEDYPTVAAKVPHLLVAKVKVGLPPQLRGLIWQAMSQSASTNLQSLYEQLVEEPSAYGKVIHRDLSRTFPKVDMFKEEGGQGQQAMERVLRAYSLYDAHVGYCQGLAFVVGPLLMVMPEKEGFCVFVRLMETYGMRTMYTLNMEGLQLRLSQFDSLLAQLLPSIHQHLTRRSIGPAIYASQWFLTLFAYAFPIPVILRIYDVVFAEGAHETIMRLAVAIMKRSEQDICRLQEFEEVLEFLTSKLFGPYLEIPNMLIEDALALSSVITKERMDELEREYTLRISKGSGLTPLVETSNDTTRKRQSILGIPYGPSPKTPAEEQADKAKNRHSFAGFISLPRNPLSPAPPRSSDMIGEPNQDTSPPPMGQHMKDMLADMSTLEKTNASLSRELESVSKQRDKVTYEYRLLQEKLLERDQEIEDLRHDMRSSIADSQSVSSSSLRDSTSSYAHHPGLSASQSQEALVQKLAMVQEELERSEKAKQNAQRERDDIFRDYKPIRQRLVESKKLAMELQLEKLGLIQKIEGLERTVRTLSVRSSSSDQNSNSEISSQDRRAALDLRRRHTVYKAQTTDNHDENAAFEIVSKLANSEERCRELEKLLADAKLKIVMLETANQPHTPLPSMDNAKPSLESIESDNDYFSGRPAGSSRGHQSTGDIPSIRMPSPIKAGKSGQKEDGKGRAIHHHPISRCCMEDDEEDRTVAFVFYGTEFPEPVEKDGKVKDEGWAPSTFTSSRNKKDGEERKQYRAEDFMDEEDISDFGLKGQIKTTQEFDILGGTQRELEQRKALAEAVEKDEATFGILPSKFISDLVVPKHDPIGIRLLRRMGWRPGQGIGPREQRKRKRDQKEMDEEDDDFDIHAKEVLFAPKDTAVVKLENKTDKRGLGYDPFRNDRHVEEMRRLRAQARLDGENPDNILASSDADRKRKRIEGFGIGVLEEDEDHSFDLYGDSESQRPSSLHSQKVAYRSTIIDEDEDESTYHPVHKQSRVGPSQRDAAKSRSRGHEQCCDGRSPLAGFHLASEKPQAAKWQPPVVPDDYKPIHAFKEPEKPAEAPLNPGERHELTFEKRGRILGETPLEGPARSVFDTMTPEAKQQLESKTGVSLGSTSSTDKSSSKANITFPPIDKSVALSALKGFMPFGSNLAKQNRYRQYLEHQAGLVKHEPVTIPPSLRAEEYEQELSDFKKSAMIYRPMSSMMASRFTSATKTVQLVEEVQGGLRTTPLSRPETPIESPVQKPDPKSVTTAEEAAALNMFGPLTRTISDFYPNRLLCKRFNVINPHPDHKEDKVSSGMTAMGSKEALSKDAMEDMMKERNIDTMEEYHKSGKASQAVQQEMHELDQSLILPKPSQLEQTPTIPAQEVKSVEDKLAEDKRPNMDIFEAIFGTSDTEDDEDRDDEEINKESRFSETADQILAPNLFSPSASIQSNEATVVEESALHAAVPQEPTLQQTTSSLPDLDSFRPLFNRGQAKDKRRPEEPLSKRPRATALSFMQDEDEEDEALNIGPPLPPNFNDSRTDSNQAAERKDTRHHSLQRICHDLVEVGIKFAKAIAKLNTDWKGQKLPYRGRKRSNNPNMSFTTSTCPEQPTPAPIPMTANKHFKKVNVTGNAIVAANWDKKLTLKQNYAKLGLMTSLNGQSGGREKVPTPKFPDEELPEANIEELEKTLQPGEGLIERDEEGNVVRVIVGKEKPFDEMIEEPVAHVEAKTDVVKALEAQAANVLKVERTQSGFEKQWIEKLIEKHGNDYEAMFWDKKLNVYQQTAAQLKRKIAQYKRQTGTQ
ncbi:hypothetical protein BZG36_01923, partial [Bifiguratus adelaidae]